MKQGKLMYRMTVCQYNVGMVFM